MKKIKILLLTLVCALSTIKISPVNASDNEINEKELEAISSDYVTYEDPMPVIDTQLNSSLVSSSETRRLPERQKWIDDTIVVSEQIYNQEIDYVTEDQDYIRFVFKPNDFVILDQKLDSSNVQYTEFQIDEVAYLKPEAKGIYDPDKLQAKIITMWGWSNGYYVVDEKTGIYNSIANVFLTYCGPKEKLFSWILGEALGYTFSSIDKNKSATGECRNKHYYKNKWGSIYNGSVWAPTAAVGEKRSLAWAWGMAHKESGEPVPNIFPAKQANDTTNPTNYDHREKKPHYDDDQWILNKAKETYGYGGYYDCYGYAGNQ